AAAARGERDVVLVAPPHHRGDLFGGGRHDDRVGRSRHAAAHQVGEIAALRLENRFRRQYLRELHGADRTLWLIEPGKSKRGVAGSSLPSWPPPPRSSSRPPLRPPRR